ncbi:MAG: lipid-A-disaccharide synthase [Bryobacteraceae bacterium]|nr:lipid-A-disaccharide synthase [Bryobacteraceae bacterium]MDW8380264.1 lipid-A-disaccharide synthase [Bryobacterales bacterium]
MPVSVRPAKVFISAGEPSGDFYAAALLEQLRKDWPEVDWFGCTGPQMRAAGVRTLLDQSELAVVGLAEVLVHLPRIYWHYRRLQRQLRAIRPDLAILTDSPDFHLRLAEQLRRMQVPVVYLVAPQAWAWRRGRVKAMGRDIQKLLCLFPFEEPFFRRYGIDAHYIGHPLASRIGAHSDRHSFFARHFIPSDQPVVALCPGSRRGEISRHLPVLEQAVKEIRQKKPATFLLATPQGMGHWLRKTFFEERIAPQSIQVIEGQTWDVLAHADLVLAASGTVTMEAALLGTPLVTFYKVTAVSWLVGRFLVKVPFYSMVNLIAERKIVPELIQNEMTGPRLAQEALRLLESESARAQMKRELAEVAGKLTCGVDPMERAAAIIRELFHAQR